MSNFNPIEYSNKLNKFGLNKDLSDYQAEELNKIVIDELVTKDYLKEQIVNMENRLVIKLGALMIALVTILTYIKP